MLSEESNEDLAQRADQIASGSPSFFQKNPQRDVAEDVRTLAALVAELFRRLSSLEDDAGEADAEDPSEPASP